MNELNDNAEEMGVVNVESVPRGRFEVHCDSCGKLSEDYGTVDEAQAAGREHAVSHAPKWTVYAV
ncbi:MAG TPA: hypothetical protein VF855_05515 [Acidimicrobiales bacterium]